MKRQLKKQSKSYLSSLKAEDAVVDSSQEKATELYIHGISNRVAFATPSIDTDIRIFLAECDAASDRSLLEILCGRDLYFLALEKARSVCSNCNLLLEHYIESEAGKEYALLFKIPEDIASRDDFLSFIYNTKCSSVFISGFGVLSFDEPKLFLCYQEHTKDSYIIFKRFRGSYEKERFVVDSSFLYANSLPKIIASISESQQIQIESEQIHCPSCIIDYANIYHSKNLSLADVKPFFDSRIGSVVLLLESFGFNTLVDTVVSRLTYTQLTVSYCLYKYLLSKDSEIYNRLDRLSCSFSPEVRAAIKTLCFPLLDIISRDTHECTFESMRFDRQRLCLEFQELKNVSQGVYFLNLAPTLGSIKEVKAFFEKHCADEVEQITGVHPESTFTNLFSYFNFYPIVSKLFLLHPLSKIRGLQASDFGFSRNAQLSKGVLEEPEIQYNQESSTRDITYLGIGISHLLHMPIHDLFSFVERMIPQRVNIIKICLSWSLGHYSLNTSLSSIPLFDRCKLKLIKEAFTSKKKKKILLCTDYESLFITEADREVFKNLINAFEEKNNLVLFISSSSRI